MRAFKLVLKRLLKCWLFKSISKNIKQRRKKKKNFSSLYLMECKGMYKIGISNDPERRYNTFLTGNPDIKMICYSKPVSFAFMLETKLHRLFKKDCVHGEWFKLKEQEVNSIIKLLNNLSEDDYENIANLMKGI